MNGGDGNDTYYVTAGRYRSGLAGTDTINSFISWSLSADEQRREPDPDRDGRDQRG